MVQKTNQNIKSIPLKRIFSEVLAYIVQKPDELLAFSIINFAFMSIFGMFISKTSDYLFLPWVCAYYAFWFGFFRYYYNKRPYVFTKNIFGTLVPSTKILLLMFLLISAVVFVPFIPLFMGYNDEYAVFIDRYVSDMQTIGAHGSAERTNSVTFSLLLYGVLLLLTPNILIRPMFAWISSLIGRSGSIGNAYSNSRGNYFKLLLIAIVFELPMEVIEQIFSTFGLNQTVMWLISSPFVVLGNVAIIKLYDFFFLSIDQS